MLWSAQDALLPSVTAPPADQKDLLGSSGLVLVRDDLVEMKRENLLLEREKLSLEIQILRLKMARMTSLDSV